MTIAGSSAGFFRIPGAWSIQFMINKFKIWVRKQIRKKQELREFKQYSTEQVFTRIYTDNKWGDNETRSGKGSTLNITSDFRMALPDLLASLEVESMLDIPCGDFHWMQTVELPLQRYLGADIVKPLIEENQRLYSNQQRRFLHLNLLTDPLPDTDVIFCRECLVHLSFDDISRAVSNIKRSEATYLFTTHFPEIRHNQDIVTGKHHCLNLTLPPFNWPQPLTQIVEYHAGKRRGNKCLSVWKIADIPAAR